MSTSRVSDTARGRAQIGRILSQEDSRDKTSLLWTCVLRVGTWDPVPSVLRVSPGRGPRPGRQDGSLESRSGTLRMSDSRLLRGPVLLFK